MHDTHDVLRCLMHNEPIQIGCIKADSALQSRAMLNEEVIAEYAEKMAAGVILPPVKVFDDESGGYWLADGFHRYYAALRIELDELRCDVFVGERRDALLYSVSSNTSHGLRRSAADKRRAVELLLEDEEWSQWSDREIARRTGTSHPFVAKIRAELSGNRYQMPTERKAMRGGVEYTVDTSKIGKAPVSTQEISAPELLLDEEERVILEHHRTGQTVIINMRIHPRLMQWAKEQGVFVRVDRRSEWGNPHKMHEEVQRGEVLERFLRDYLPGRPDLLARVPELKGKILGCWCYPQACHGEKLAMLADGELQIAPVEASTEVCDGIDDDCNDDDHDGQVEEAARQAANALLADRRRFGLLREISMGTQTFGSVAVTSKMADDPNFNNLAQEGLVDWHTPKRCRLTSFGRRVLELFKAMDNDCDGKLDEVEQVSLIEVCDGIDNDCNDKDDDCDGPVDETPQLPWYEDATHPAYTSDAARANRLIHGSKSERVDSSNDDCKGQVEACDGKDDDCDGPVDEAPKPTTAQLLISSKSNDWYTPEEIIELAREVMGGIDLDPASCAEANEIVRATTFYTKEQDGLSLPWYGRIWLNPPYGTVNVNDSSAGLWSGHLFDEYSLEDTKIEQATVLVNAAIGREWFNRLWLFPICFPYKRIKFWRPGTNKNQPTFGNTIAYLGPNEELFAERFATIGRIVLPVGDDVSLSYDNRSVGRSMLGHRGVS